MHRRGGLAAPLRAALALLAALTHLAPPARIAAQAPSPPDNSGVAVRVGTPKEFKEALQKEVAHIVITEHMDLSTFTNATRSAQLGTLVYRSNSNDMLAAATLSITACTPRAPLQSLPLLGSAWHRWFFFIALQECTCACTVVKAQVQLEPAAADSRASVSSPRTQLMSRARAGRLQDAHRRVAPCAAGLLPANRDRHAPEPVPPHRPGAARQGVSGRFQTTGASRTRCAAVHPVLPP
jgi:hypothetical protein